MDKNKKYSLSNLTVRLFKIASPVKGYFIVSTIASVIGNLAQMGLMGFGVLALLCCVGKIDGSANTFAVLAGVSAFMVAAFRYIEGVVSHIAAYGLLAGMRVNFFEVIRRLAPACLMDREKGDIINIALSDMETIEFFFAHTIGPVCTVILLPCITMIMAFNIHPYFAFVLLPIYLFISVLFPIISVKIGKPIGVRFRKSLGKMKTIVLESVYGLRDIQIFEKGQARMQTMDDCNSAINKASHGLTMHRQMVTAAPTFFIYLVRIAIIALASFIAVAKGLDTSGVIVLSFVSAASFSTTLSLTTVVSSLLETYAAAERIFTLEDTETETKNPDAPVKLEKIKNIEFSHVDFQYKSKSVPILKDFCLTVNENEIVGIMGESGIGKSTILRLLMRFWNVKAGTIFINGIPIENYSTDDIYKHITFLEQDTFLFDDTIAANIAMGKPNASKDEIISAAKRACVHDLIMTLPDGYETRMGQMGDRLSGGEKQRIGIARTLIMNPDVIVMDEPTSSLDILHECEFLETLKKECRDKIIIIVSHRASTLTICDRVITLQSHAN